jgi:anti-sigma B factor antagonist
VTEERLRVETLTQPDRIVLELHGELDLAAAPLLEAEIQRTESDPRGILILDVEDLQFIDSAGLRTILATHQSWTDRGRSFAITPGSPQVQRMLTVAGVRDHLPTVASPQDATMPNGASPGLD